MALNPKQKLFVETYLANGYHAKEAYLQVYTNSSEYSAKSNAFRLLANPEVKEMIRQEQELRFNSLCINAERIAEELAEMAFAAKGDKDYTATVKLKALDLLQSQLGLKNNKINIDGELDTKITIIEDM